MLSSTPQSRVTWGAVVAALIVGLALLLILTSPGSHPQPAQAQTVPTASTSVLSIDGVNIANFSNVDEVTSSVRLPRAAGTAAKLEPIRIVLERTADSNVQLSSWHTSAVRQKTGYTKDATLTVFDSTGAPTLKLFLENAWPAEYQLEQQGDQVVERVTLTATSIQRVSPQ